MATILPVRQTLFSPAGQQILAGMPSPEAFSGRMAFARAVCGRFDFIDARGRFRDPSCIAALRDPGAAGRITLPSGIERRQASSRPLMLSMPAAPAVRVPQRVDRVSGLDVRLVGTKAGARLLALLLARILHDGHPQGAVQHGGRQLRYPITSDHGVLGGFVFASPALALKPRDQWVGWNPGQRRLLLIVPRCRPVPVSHSPARAVPASRVKSHWALSAAVADGFRGALRSAAGAV